MNCRFHLMRSAFWSETVVLPARPEEVRVTLEVSRRQLMASAGGMVLASFALPAGLRKLIDGVAPAAPGQARLTNAPLSEIKHVVVLMQENRSFDHYFGAMPGVRGFSDPTAITLGTGRSVFYQPVQ